MGTRGVMGVRVGGRDRATYNHYDSYPSGLGAAVIHDIQTVLKEAGLDYFKKLATDVRMVNEDDKPSAEEIELLKEHADTSVSSGRLEEWYVLMRDLQGKLLDTLKTGFMIEYSGFLGSSLFCEWAYIVNFDTNKLEVYKGFNKNPAAPGRYSALKNGGDGEYYGVSLLKEYDLNDLIEADVDKLTEELDKLAYPEDEE